MGYPDFDYRLSQRRAKAEQPQDTTVGVKTRGRPYHPANLKLQPFAKWKVISLAWVAKALGVQFKIDGIPYGAAYRKDLWEDHYDNAATGSGDQ